MAASDALDRLGWLDGYRDAQGGFSYLPGRKPRVEPTAYAMLAGLAASRDAEWLAREVTASFGNAVGPHDGAVARELTEHPWLLALATVALTQAGRQPEALLGGVVDSLHGEDVRATFAEFFDKDEPELAGALPWRRPSYGWVEPTSWGLLAESAVVRATDEKKIRRRAASHIPARVAFLLSRLTTDGAWNYGGVTVLGIDLAAMPQTSAVCLVALASAYESAADYDIELPEFDPDGPLARMLELEELEPSRLSRAWSQLALLAWRRDPSGLDDVSADGPRPGESLVDAALGLVVARAKRERAVPMLGAHQAKAEAIS